MQARCAWIGLHLLTAACMPQTAQADVWKCTADGRTQYSDQPCQVASRGERVAARLLQGNVIDVGRPTAESTTRPLQADAAVPDERGAAPGPIASVCPSDRDIVSMETTASSIRLDPEAKRFVQDEIRRARQCQKGQGQYSAADWAISREAVAAQNSLTGAADARIRSESMHSAANPAEGDRIARRQEPVPGFRLHGPRQAVPAQEVEPSRRAARAPCAGSLPCASGTSRMKQN